MGSTRYKILELLKREGSQTAGELAEKLGISSVAVRQHLLALGSDGVLVPIPEKRNVGRPVRRWHIGSEATSYFPDSHDALAVELLEAIRNTEGAEGVERVVKEKTRLQIERYRSKISKACNGEASVENRLEALVAIRNAEGHMAEHHPDGDKSWLLIQNHCPVCAASTTCRQLCKSEPILFQSVLGDEVEVKRAESIHEGARRCSYTITKVE